MNGFPPGTQARIRGFEGDAEANGRICVSISCTNDRITARLATGRELSVPQTCLQRIAAPGALPARARVRLAGLTKAPELNGRSATVEDTTKHPAGRLMVNLGTGPAKALKFENLVLVDSAGACGGAFARGVKVTVKGHVDPGYNGLEGVVLDGDCNDTGRLLVMLPSAGRAVSLTPSNCTGTGVEATSFELAALGPPLKEAFFTEVRKFLWGQPNDRASLHLLFGADSTARANPYSPESRVYASWTALCAAYDQAQSIRDVLKERALFEIVRDPKGFEAVALTAAGRQMNVSEGVPEPPSKRKRVEEDTGKQKQDEFARIIFSALQLCAPKRELVSISQIGSDVRVMELRKDPQFEKKKLVDVLHAYPNVFELEAEPPPSSGWKVRLKEDAEIALPMRRAGEAAPEAAGDVLPDPEEACLPEKMDCPETTQARIQSLRIELIHALQRRNGQADMGSLGQEPGVQKIRREIGKGRSLMEFVRIFPKNFAVVRDTPNTAKPQVKLCSKDVEDMSSLENWMRKYRDPPPRSNGKRSRGGKSDGPSGQQPGPPAAGYIPYPQMGFPPVQGYPPPQGYPVAQPFYGCPAPAPGYAAPAYGYAMPPQQPVMQHAAAPQPAYGHAQYPQQPAAAYAAPQPGYAQAPPSGYAPQPAGPPATYGPPAGYPPASGYACGAPDAYGHHPAPQHAYPAQAPGYSAAAPASYGPPAQQPQQQPGYAGYAGYAPPQHHGGAQGQWQ